MNMRKALHTCAQLSGRQARTTCCSVPHTQDGSVFAMLVSVFLVTPSHLPTCVTPWQDHYKPCWCFVRLCQALRCMVNDFLSTTCNPLLQIMRDKNHPSIIAWSCGNESGFGKAHTDMAKFYRQLDPYRPTHYEVQWSLPSLLCRQQPVLAILCLSFGVS